MSKTPIPPPSQRPPEEEPPPEGLVPDWNEAIDSWSASLESLEGAPEAQPSSERAQPDTSAAAPQSLPLHRPGGEAGEHQGTPAGHESAPLLLLPTVAQSEDSGLVHIPNLDELSASIARGRPVVESPFPLQAGRKPSPRPDTNFEPEHTEPVLDFVVDAEEVLLSEDVDTEAVDDPFVGPAPVDEDVALEAAPEAPSMRLQEFADRTDWLSVTAPRMGPTSAYREERLALLADELEARQAQGAAGTSIAWVAVEAARAAHMAGSGASAGRLIERACAAAPAAVAPYRERLRLAADAEGAAHAGASVPPDKLLSLIEDVGARAGQQAPVYHTLAQALRAAVSFHAGFHTSSFTPAEGAVDLASMLAMAVSEIRQQRQEGASAALAALGRLLRAELGSEMLSAAARLLEFEKIGDGGASLRAEAHAMAPQAASPLLATLRLAGVLSAGDALQSAQVLLLRLSDPTLRGALGRWACALATNQGNVLLAAEVLASVVDGRPLTSLAVSDRLALLPLHLPEVIENPEGWVEGLEAEAAALFLSTAAEMVLRLQEPSEALRLVELALTVAPGAGFAAIFAERVAQSQSSGAVRARALSLWAQHDAARTPVARLELAVGMGAGGADTAGAQDAAVRALPRDAAWLPFAWSHIEAQRFDAAVSLLHFGAQQWEQLGEPSLAAAIRERAEDLQFAGTPTRAVVRAMARSSLVEDSLDHPRVLALAALQKANDPSAVAAVYRAAAVGNRQLSVRAIETIVWLQAAAQRREALQFLQARLGSEGVSSCANMLMRVLANTYDDPESAATVFERLSASAGPPEHQALWLFRQAEALAGSAAHSQAANTLRDMGATHLQLEAHVAYARALWASHSYALLDALLRDEADAMLGVGAEDEAASVLCERARVRVEGFADTEGASILLQQALSFATRNPLVISNALTLAAMHSDSEGVRAALEMQARGADPDAALLCVLTSEVKPDQAAVQPWIAAALSPPHEGRLTLLQRTLHPQAEVEAWQRASRSVSGRADGDPRLRLALDVRTAEAHLNRGELWPALELLQSVVAIDTRHLPALRLAARVALAAGQADVAVELLILAAKACLVAAHRSALYLEAAAFLESRNPAQAETLLRDALDAEPTNEAAFAQLHRLLQEREDKDGLADLLRVRLQGDLPAEEVERLRLQRARLLEATGHRAAAKAELRSLLNSDPQNTLALGELVELEYEDGAFSVAAEIYLRLARLETDPQTQGRIFRRLGRIYHRRLSDPKLAAGAYERVLKMDANDLDALTGLSEIYSKQNDLPRAINATERALPLDPDPNRRLTFQLRLAALHEKRGDSRVAGDLLRRAVEVAPRSLQAIGELARHYERHRDAQARRVLLDTSLSRLHEDLRRFPGDLSALRAIVPVLRWCARDAGSAAAAQVLAALTEDANERREMRAWSVAPAKGRRLTPLLNPDVDELAYPTKLPPGLRQVMRILGPPLSRSTRPDLHQWGVTRSSRLPASEEARLIFDAVGMDLGLRGFEVFVSPDLPWVMVVEPGDPPAIILGRGILNLGAPALRFAAGYTLRLVATHFDLLASAEPGAAAMLAGLVEQFLPFNARVEAGLDEQRVASASARLNKVLGRSLRTELRPFVAEIASPESLANVAAVVEESASRVGLLASGDLAVSLQILMAARGVELSGPALAAVPVASALFDFALSSDYELLVRQLDSVS